MEEPALAALLEPLLAEGPGEAAREAALPPLLERLDAAGAAEAAAFLGAAVRLLRPELTRDAWKRRPATKLVFSRALLRVARPALAPLLGSVLPAALLISDDHEEPNKLLGVRCLRHIVRNVPAADLRQYNRAQVVYHALYNHLYSREAPLVEAALLALLDLLPVLEGARRHRRQQEQEEARPAAAAPGDEVLRLLLTHMEAEHRLPLRRVYARALPAFVRRLGIRVCRHLKRLERVVLGYLEVPDGPDEEARLAALETLRCAAEHAWPRMPCRLPALLPALLKMLWDVRTDAGPTPEPVRAALLQGATECLVLLDRCSAGRVKVLLEGVYESCEDGRVRECIRKVREDT